LVGAEEVVVRITPTQWSNLALDLAICVIGMAGIASAYWILMGLAKLLDLIV